LFNKTCQLFFKDVQKNFTFALKPAEVDLEFSQKMAIPVRNLAKAKKLSQHIKIHGVD
jgi:hypothetical protein